MKNAPEKPPCHQFYFSLDGSVRAACGSIFSSSDLEETNLFEVNPFIECCKNVLLQQSEEALDEFLIPAVQLEFDSWGGIFDHFFLKIRLNEEEAIFWFVVEKTHAYRQQQSQQQQQNERALTEEADTSHFFNK